MKIVLIVFTFFIEYSFSAGNLESIFNHCCNVGKIWSEENKNCNINLTLPLFNVDEEYNPICINTIGICCLQSLRKLMCNEGKQLGLENGICYEINPQGKNLIDFKICCEICKIGIAIGSTKTVCQSTPLFNDHLWGDVFQSCCKIANTKIKSFSSGIEKIYDTTDQCIHGTHNCTPKEKCVSTPNGFECHPYQSPLPPLQSEMIYQSPVQQQPSNNSSSRLSTIPELMRVPPYLTDDEKSVRSKKKQNNYYCSTGYAYDVYNQKCADVDECKQRPCDINEICENTVGSFKCHCKSGFQLDNITNACIDINECQLNTHSCKEFQRCDNTVGSYQCVRFTGCGTGYTLEVESALCLDDNECALKTDTCGILGPEYVCKNTLGSFRCEKKSCRGPSCKDKDSSKNTKHVNRTPVKCLRGYEMDKKNKCIDINECRFPFRCSSKDLCINTNGSYYCLPKSNNYPN